MDKQKNLPAYKVGRLWKFKLSEIDDWVRSGGADDRIKNKLRGVLDE
nr:hypothetical protein [Lactococcus lactis]